MLWSGEHRPAIRKVIQRNECLLPTAKLIPRTEQNWLICYRQSEILQKRHKQRHPATMVANPPVEPPNKRIQTMLTSPPVYSPNKRNRGTTVSRVMFPKNWMNKGTRITDTDSPAGSPNKPTPNKTIMYEAETQANSYKKNNPSRWPINPCD